MNELDLLQAEYRSAVVALNKAQDAVNRTAAAVRKAEVDKMKGAGEYYLEAVFHNLDPEMVQRTQTLALIDECGPNTWTAYAELDADSFVDALDRLIKKVKMSHRESYIGEVITIRKEWEHES